MGDEKPTKRGPGDQDKTGMIQEKIVLVRQWRITKNLILCDTVYVAKGKELLGNSGNQQ